MALKDLVPQAVKAEMRLRRTQHRFPEASYIRSSLVSSLAQIGVGVGIGTDVVVNAGVSIGAHTYVNPGSLLISGAIGKYCSIAHYVCMGAEEHPLRHLSTSPVIYGQSSITGAASNYIEVDSPPLVGNDVWIGTAASIMQGVRVGDGAVIAACAVLTKDVQPYEIWAGVPARKIGQRFDDALIEHLRTWRWWDLPEDQLSELAPLVSAGSRWPDLIAL